MVMLLPVGSMVVVMMMCVVLLLLVLLGYLFYFSGDVAVFVTRAFCIIKRNKE